MKPLENNPHKETESSPHKRLLGINIFAVALMACVLCVIIFLFARSYRSLQDAIFQERIDYVEEISAQIITNQLFMEKEYSKAVANLANILEHEDVATKSGIHEYSISVDEGDILLVTEDNDIVDLRGKHISMPNTRLIQQMLDNPGVTELFTSLNYEDDSWLFAAPITPRVVDDMICKAIILAVSADEFRANMTISLFDDQGASYIVGNDGRIKIKPLSDNLAFNGYNLFSSMISQGASKEDVALLESALQNDATGSTLISVGRLDWLVGHTPIDSDSTIIVAVPLSLTAARTYDGLSRTIVLASLSILMVSAVALLLILQLIRRDRLREKEALAVAAKNEFFSKMSHDIRTPLNAIIGLTTLANDSAGDSAMVREYLEQSLASSNYLLAIINDVLDVSRIESGKLEIDESPFDMNELLADVKVVSELMIEEKELVFTDEIPRFHFEYIGDQVRIKQILANLMSNASKFTERGGNVGLRVTAASRDDGYDVMTMAVSDTGIGMSEEFLSRIFAPFEQERSSYTEQYAGSGLGLSIVHELVELMGGTIEVESAVNEGSTFTVTLPLLRGKELSRGRQVKKSKSSSFVGKRILLAEDNDVNQMVTTRLLLNKFGIKADVTSDGAAAVEAFSDSPAGTYDMILMDVKMPVMDGLAATRAIRALPRPDARSIPIVALSANAYAEDKNLSLAAGMNDHLPKPLDTNVLASVFQQYFK